MSKPIDRRTAERYIDKGTLSRAEYESYLKALPDDSANATIVQMDIEETEIGGDAAISNGVAEGV